MANLSNVSLKEYLKHAVELETSLEYLKRQKKDGETAVSEIAEPKFNIYAPRHPNFTHPDWKKDYPELEYPEKPKEPSLVDVSIKDCVLVFFVFLGIAGIIACIIWKIFGNFFVPFCIGLGIDLFFLIGGMFSHSTFKKEKVKYEQKLEEYNKAYGEIDEKRQIILRDFKEKEAVLNKAKDDEYAQKKKDHEEKVIALRARKDEALQAIGELDIPIKETENALNQYYSKDIIYPNYRNLVAVCTIYEYFDSGRCTELEGVNGAYNLFESELRQNLIISKLDDILANLMAIQAGQFLLYQKLDSIDKTAKNISSQMKDIVSNTEIIAANTADIAKNTKKIADNTSKTMVLSLINAQCSIAMAKNTEAMKYLALIK